MADAKKCDVCGKFYIESDKDKHMVNNPKFRLKDRDLSWIKVIDHNDNCIGTFDLCDDCAKKLYNFICNINESEG